jgi:NADP-dependent 3-hydroxy acid dehydrogenase YdfG
LNALRGGVAVVTGGGTGVGAAIALALAAEKAKLCLVGRRLEPLESIAERARQLGGEATCHSADLASESDLSELSRKLTAELTRVDILVQNAGLYIPASIESGSLDNFDALYRTNVRAPFALAQALLPLLRACCGQIVFINSSAGLRARAHSVQYDATKHALKAIADSLRDEVNAEGVRVLSVYLGQTASEMQRRIHDIAGKLYRPELLLQPQDIASIILSALTLPRTAEVTDVHIRPMIKS